MLKSFHVFGPTKVLYGNTAADPTDPADLIGQSDGQALITIRESAPHFPVTTDAFGGQPEDFVQQMPHCVIAVTFIDWGEGLISRLLAGLKSDSVPGTLSQVNRGQAGAVGMLAYGDRPARRLIIKGTKLQASGEGGTVLGVPVTYNSIRFYDVIRDPTADDEAAGIGNPASTHSVVLRARPVLVGGANTMYDFATI